MQKITPFLWFNDRAEEAIHFYTRIFSNSAILETHYVPPNETTGAHNLLTARFQLEGQQFMAINGGPHFQFNPAISLFVNCHTQEEVDNLWQQLGAGGSEEPCGWLRDKFGVSWQIIPKQLGEMLHDRNPLKAQATMNAMMSMRKIIIADLEHAYHTA